MTAGMFLVNQHPAVVLFDSRASHLFMSQALTSKHGQHVVDLDNGKFCISAAGNQISTNQLVKDVNIAIEGRNVSANPVILPGLGIDVILGMNWMSNNGVLIDTSTRVVMLREPDSKEAFLVQLPKNNDIRHAANAIRPLTVAEIPVVCEFPGMSFQRIYLDCHETETYCLKLILFWVPHLSLEGHIECHPMN